MEFEDLFLEGIFGINLSHSIDQTNGRVRIRIPFSTNYMRISSLIHSSPTRAFKHQLIHYPDWLLLCSFPCHENHSFE